jgi:antitoxin component of MazEF toxin-antitoxin module
MARTIILPKGKYGDITIGWDESNNDKVLPILQEMIDQKWLFFILDPEGIKTPVTDVDQANTKSIVIPNDLLEQLHLSGILKVGARIEGDLATTGEVARTAEVLATADAIVTPPASGG